MSLSSESFSSSLGKIAVDLAAKALEDFLEDEEMQKMVAETVTGSVASSVAGSSQAISEASKAENDLSSFLGDINEEA